MCSTLEAGICARLYAKPCLSWHGVMQMWVGAGVLDLSFHALAQERVKELQSLVHKAVGSTLSADTACCLVSRNTFLTVDLIKASLATVQI